MWCTNGQHRARNANSSLLAYVVVVMSRCIMFVAGQAGKLWYIQTVPYFDNVTHPNKLAACNTVELVLPWSAKPCASGMLYEAAQPDDATAHHCLHSRIRLQFVPWLTCYDHTIQKRPALIRTRKSTWIGPHQYWGERSPGNPRCRSVLTPPNGSWQGCCLMHTWL